MVNLDNQAEMMPFGLNPNPYKKNLQINQNEQHLHIEGNLAKQWLVKKLVFVFRKTKEQIGIPSEKSSNQFLFQVDLQSLLGDCELSGDYLDIYLDVEISRDDYDTIEADWQPIEVEEQLDQPTLSFQLRLGEFEKTVFTGIETVVLNDQSVRMYITKNNNFSIALNKSYTKKPLIEVASIEMKKQALAISGSVLIRNAAADTAKIVWVGRDTGQKLVFALKSLEKSDDQESYFGLMRYDFAAEIETEQETQDLLEDSYDIYLNVSLLDDTAVDVRLKEPELETKSFSEGLTIWKKANAFYTISPHVTHGKGNLSLLVFELQQSAYYFLQVLIRFASLIRPLFTWRNIWIVGELPYKAQDTGYHFFKYMREKHPGRNVYYVIDPSSPEYKNVKKLGNILIHKSIKHMFYTVVATRMIGSHHPDYLYPLRSPLFKSLVKAKKVFLQHGVMGTRNSGHYYGVESKNFETDLFIVSSDFEKKMIVTDFGYKPEQVKVTGLSRFDSLFDGQVKLKRQLLIIPTWREWLTKEASFLKSEYYDRYKALINSEKLHEISANYQLKIVFCLHPNMQKYSKHFEHENVTIINQGEVDVQHLLKESMMMITDYSSVAFDFSFLAKPVLYYQFDRAKFIGERGSHLNLKKDLPGPIVHNETDLVATLEQYARNEFQMEETYQKRTKKFLKYKDRNSNKRIYRVIQELPKP